MHFLGTIDLCIRSRSFWIDYGNFFSTIEHAASETQCFTFNLSCLAIGNAG